MDSRFLTSFFTLVLIYRNQKVNKTEKKNENSTNNEGLTPVSATAALVDDCFVTKSNTN
jgi:hypothetical protein